MVRGEGQQGTEELEERVLEKARVAYSMTLERAKRAHQRSRCEQLEKDMECPKRFWRALKKMNIGKVKKTRSNLLQVYEEGSVKLGEEALGI